MGAETVHALRAVSFNIDRGEAVAVIGSSGSGKSTLMNIMGCLDTPSQGSYTFVGENVSALSGDALAKIRNRSIGFVFQSFQLLPRRTALENVLLPLTYRREEKIARAQRREMAAMSLEKVGLGDRMQHRPNEMSGGQRQRVAIARALVADPELILADEPTGNLDTKTSQEILDLLLGLVDNQQRTLVVVTHEPEVAVQCSRTVRLRDGEVISDASNAAVSGNAGMETTHVE